MQLSAQKQTLAVLLGGIGLQLVIPPYQRPYAWEREQIDDLWDDIMSSLDDGHFMGSIVLNAEDPERPQVIDGQQRLTTLLLLARIIQDRYLALGANDRAEGLYQLFFADTFGEGDARYRLRTGDANWAVFRDYVLRRHDDSERKRWVDAANEPRVVRAKNLRLFENARVLSDKLETWLYGIADDGVVERLTRLQQTLIKRLEFVVVSVNSAPDAFLLFETLNDRGLQLSQGDLLKNHLLSRVAATGANTSAEIEEAADEWEGLLDDLGQKADVTRFLRHYLLARSFPVKKEQVFDRFKAQVASSGPHSLLRELRTFGKLYGQLADPARVQNDPAVQAQLNALTVLRAESCYPALLVAMRFLPRDQFLNFAWLCEVLTYRYSSVCGFDAKELQASYHRAAKLILETQGTGVEEARGEISRMIPGSDQFVASFERQRMGAQYLARYTLQRIEGALNPGKEFKANDAVHIEHVMPQTPSEEWKAVLGIGIVDHPALVQRWGNLTLLHAPLNQGASNRLFVQKQDHYHQSEVGLTKDLCRYLRWGLDVIDQRQSWMASVADSIWSVDGYHAVERPQPLRLQSALEALADQERVALERLIPEQPPESPLPIEALVREHADALIGERAAGIELSDAIIHVTARWDELGTDGRRLITGTSRYFVEAADAIHAHEAGGLEDDARVVRAVCDALQLKDLLPEEPLGDGGFVP